MVSIFLKKLKINKKDPTLIRFRILVTCYAVTQLHSMSHVNPDNGFETRVLYGKYDSSITKISLIDPCEKLIKLFFV